MNINKTLLAAALGLSLAGVALAAPMSEMEAQALLERRGFDDVSVLVYENGVWAGTAIDENGERVNVRVNPSDEKVMTTRTTTTITPAPTRVVTEIVEKPVVVDRVVERPVVVERVIEQPVVRSPIVVQERVLVPLGGKIDKSVVHAVLIGAGYHDIHDIDWLSHRGVWKAEARDPTGDDREIHVDPYDARIVHVEED